jgi:hypothetical protein
MDDAQGPTQGPSQYQQEAQMTLFPPLHSTPLSLISMTYLATSFLPITDPHTNVTTASFSIETPRIEITQKRSAARAKLSEVRCGRVGRSARPDRVAGLCE